MTDAVTACEDILRKERAISVEVEMLVGEVEVIDRLLDRKLELVDAYAELHRKLHGTPWALAKYLQSVLTTAALWNPAAVEETRTARERLRQVNRSIAKKAAELSKLLDERYSLHNESGFSGGTYYHIGQVIEAAGAEHGLYRFRVAKRFRALRSEFGLKYWPTPSACIAALGRDAEKVSLAATDRITAAATEGRRGSLTDFFRAFFEMIKENSEEENGPIPNEFWLSDDSVAALANCALDLEPEAMVDSIYVKRLRQRERERIAAQLENQDD